MTPDDLNMYVTPTLSGMNLAVLVLVLHRLSCVEKTVGEIFTRSLKTAERLTRVETKLED